MKSPEERREYQREYMRRKRGEGKYNYPDPRVWVLRTYGLTLDDYDNILESQNNGCAICGKAPEDNGQRLAVDHDHDTGAVRGLLCIGCNAGLGSFKDDPDLLEEAQKYLYRHGK